MFPTKKKPTKIKPAVVAKPVPKKAPEKPKFKRGGKYAANLVVTMLVDESGSMLHLAEATMSGFNAYVDNLKTEELHGFFSAYKFASQGARPLQLRGKIGEAMHLSPGNYQPGGGTALLDAVGNAIVETDATLRQCDGAKAIVVIQTDGEENASHYYRLNQIKAMIEERQGRGWQFVFIGAGINAFADAEKMGIYGMQTMSYSPSTRGTSAVFGAMASNTMAYATGQNANMAFTTAQSTAAGEPLTILRAKMASAPGVPTPKDKSN